MLKKYDPSQASEVKTPVSEAMFDGIEMFIRADW